MAQHVADFYRRVLDAETADVIPTRVPEYQAAADRLLQTAVMRARRGPRGLGRRDRGNGSLRSGAEAIRLGHGARTSGGGHLLYIDCLEVALDRLHTWREDGQMRYLVIHHLAQPVRRPGS